MNNESKADEERRHRLEVESIVAQLRAIDDIMFRKLCENIAFVEEILRVILEDDKITVVEVIPQNSHPKLAGTLCHTGCLLQIGQWQLLQCGGTAQ